MLDHGLDAMFGRGYLQHVTDPARYEVVDVPALNDTVGVADEAADKPSALRDRGHLSEEPLEEGLVVIGPDARPGCHLVDVLCKPAGSQRLRERIAPRR